MHFCTARVLIAGDSGQVVMRDRYSPVSWPELEILKVLHGEDAVLDIQPFVKVPQPPKAERDRLVLLYGEPVVQHIWGGNRPPTEMSPAGSLPDIDGPWFDPIMHEVRVVETPETSTPFDADEKPAKVAGGRR
jgi:hypothetical protein